jgi:serine/threonine-protein kinase RsbW
LKTNINEISIQSKTENLQLIRNFVQEIASNCELDSSVIADIVLSVDEACTNVIEHAYSSDTKGEIILKIECADDKILIEITDFGVEFNPISVPKPNIAKHLVEKKAGGLGVYIIKQLMDEIIYQRKDENTNKLTLIKYRDQIA